MHHWEKIIFSPGGQKQCTSSPHIWCKKSNLCFFIPNVLSKDVSKQTKGTKNKRDLLHCQTRIAIHSTLFTASSVSTISRKYIRHGLGETIPNVFKTIGTTVEALGNI